MAEAAGSDSPQRWWVRNPLSLVGVVVALVGAAVATVVGRATGAGWPATLGLSALLSVGLYLWARDEHKGWGDLGQGIMVSVVVATALLAVQRDADERTREATERRDLQVREAEAKRQKAAERASLQLALTMQTNLRSIALADRDLRGFFLARKNLSDADLHGANLEGADLTAAGLQGANLVGADLDNARLQGADLRGASLMRTSAGELGSHKRPATSLRRADLVEAKLQDTELDGVSFAGWHSC